MSDVWQLRLDIRGMLVRLVEELIRVTYTFRVQGGPAPGSHCTYCPKAPGDTCQMSCGENYERVRKEREADGVKVVDTP